MKGIKSAVCIITATIALGTLASAHAQDAQAPQDSQAPVDPNSAQEVSVDAIKRKYWAQGNENEMGVVQNRAYSKEHSFQVGTFGGIITTDPFLSVKNTGFSLGYHFSEYLSVHAFGWKSYVGPSAALLTFEETIKATTNNNPPRWYAGAEGTASFLYGKLSLIGKAIIYYDMHVSAGLGMTGTDNGKFLTPHAGIGQKIYLSKMVSMRIDYRLMYYKETIIEKVITPKLGQEVGHRANWSNAVTFGFDFLFGGF